MEARERLQLDRLSKDELKAYYRHLDNVVILRDNIFTEREEGRAEGRAEGRHEERVIMAKKMLADGIALDVIVKYTNLSLEEIQGL